MYHYFLPELPKGQLFDNGFLVESYLKTEKNISGCDQNHKLNRKENLKFNFDGIFRFQLIFNREKITIHT